MATSERTIPTRPYAPRSEAWDWANRLTRCAGGLAVFSLGLALILRAELGLAAWDVFHQGLADKTGISMGTIIVAVGLLLLVLWVPLRQRPGIGTILNAVEIGLLLDPLLAAIPTTHRLPVRLAALVVGLALVALGSALYIGSGLGAGPRDGIMMGLKERGLNVAVARTGIEVAVLAAGLALGGSVGLGTVAFTFGIGPAIHLCLPWFALPGRGSATPAPGEVAVVPEPG